MRVDDRERVMNQLDRLYRALTDYRKQTVGDYDCDRLRDSIASANAQEDVVELERKICKIDVDWIDAIQNGLTFIEKAIREERQFIRSNGEVVPIEKVKRVDKESVAHLARHSNLLTKEPKEGMDVIPDQLYTVERLSDYAVYENRFLYMLLCYLRDFITLRYDKILELTTTYNGSLSLNKTVTYRKQKIKCEIKLVEQRKNDPYLREYNEAKDLLSRIDLILKAVIHYLSTPLMEEVAKTPMLKPPITKTNVLKMNQNFKGCVALYDYVTAYDKAGYTVEDYHKRLNPLPDLTADEFAEATSLLSFLTYEHSMGLEERLREEYDKEELLRKEAEQAKLVEQIKNLKKRVKESGMGMEEYMLLLEKRNRALESDSAQLVVAKQEIERLNGEVETLTENVANLETEVQSLKDEIVAINERHERELVELNEKHAQEIAELHERYRLEIADLNAKHAQEIAELHERYEGELTTLREEHAQKLASLQEEHARAINELTENYLSQIDALEKRNEQALEEFEQKLKNSEEEYAIKEQKLRAECSLEIVAWKEKLHEKDLALVSAHAESENAYEERRLAEARMNAMRLQYGLIKDESEFTSEASFNELERQYRALKKLFKREWARVRKELRARILWVLFKKGENPDAPTEEQLEQPQQEIAEEKQDRETTNAVAQEEDENADGE